MANPLKELDLAPNGFQFIQELPIEAPPAKVWAALINLDGWFGMEPDRSQRPKNTFELWPGGRWFSETKDGTATLHAIVLLVEPHKLLRLSGSLGMTHLPVNSVIIFELQPRHDGKTTLLRLGQRTYGFMDADVEKRFRGGWGALLPQLKALAEHH